jgi:hypothetical protein
LTAGISKGHRDDRVVRPGNRRERKKKKKKGKERERDVGAGMPAFLCGTVNPLKEGRKNGKGKE